MMEDYTFIDFDGVILDTQDRLFERKSNLGLYNHYDQREYEKYFEYTMLHPEEWDYIIREAKSINNSVEIIRELESMKKRIAILTKVNTYREMQVKAEDIREHRKINCPIFFVPYESEKHKIIIPNNQLLVDDYYVNIDKWISNGGRGIIFDHTIEEDTKEKVKSLEFLLKK